MSDFAEHTKAQLPELLDRYFRRLRSIIQRHGPMAVAYSGGVDSAFLAYAAYDALGDDMRCVIAVSPSLARTEYRDAVAFLEKHGIPFERVDTREIDDERYRVNDPNRCYYCKSELFAAIQNVLPSEPFWRVAFGANIDDAVDYRPGAKAASERGVVAPLAEAGYGKKLIRDTAHALGLEVWDKPAAPCLASRIPYYSEVTTEKLAQVEAAEAVLKNAGFSVCRVRHHGDLAKIEVLPRDQQHLLDPSMWSRIEEGILGAGFARVEVEPSGFRSGRLNDVLDRS